MASNMCMCVHVLRSCSYHLFSTYRALLRSHGVSSNRTMPHALPLLVVPNAVQPGRIKAKQAPEHAWTHCWCRWFFRSSQNWTWTWNNQAHVSLNLGFAWRQNMAANADKKRQVQYELGLLTLGNQSKSPLWTIIPLFLLLIPPNIKN